MLGEPICVSTLSSHCRGPFRCSSIQQGVLVTVWRLRDTETFDYSSPKHLKKTTWLTTYNWGWVSRTFLRFFLKGIWYLTHTPHAVLWESPLAWNMFTSHTMSSCLLLHYSKFSCWLRAAGAIPFPPTALLSFSFPAPLLLLDTNKSDNEYPEAGEHGPFILLNCKWG